MKTIWIGEFTSKEDIEKEFRCEIPKDAEILIGAHNYDYYDGFAFVLYRHDGKLFEANAFHCSCYGLDGQWEPEETTLEALKLRNQNESATSAALKSVVQELESITRGNHE